MIIDFHTHAFPDKIAPGAIAHLLDNGRQYAAGFGLTLTNHTDGTVAGLQAAMQRAGIDYSLVLPIATSPKPSHTLNDAAAQINSMPSLRSFGSVHPRNPDWPSELERVKALGLRGIKLHPEYQQCFADSDETVAVVKAATQLGLWVLFHAGADVGMPPPVHGTPEQFLRLRQAVPNARMILAHLGGFYLWEDVCPILQELQVYIDTSYSLLRYPERWELFAKIIRQNTPWRVLFGTDCPWENPADSVRETRRFLEQYGFSPEEQAAIFGGNAAEILGLPQKEAPILKKNAPPASLNRSRKKRTIDKTPPDVGK